MIVQKTCAIPRTRLEEIQREHESMLRRRARFAAEWDAASKLGPAFDAEAHLNAWWKYLFDGGEEYPETILTYEEDRALLLGVCEGDGAYRTY